MDRLNQIIRRLVPVLLLLLHSAIGLAQGGITVKGTVVDTKGETVIGASVILKGSPRVGTVTDFDGNFVLKVPDEKSVITVSYVGCKPRDIEVGSQRAFKVVLAEEENKLNDVVVVGYGQQKKASVVGAIAQTTGKVLERTGGVSSLGAALTGNLPGVITMASTGMPGEEDPRIVIRGITSWNSSEPLVLVDGIERPISSIDISTVQTVSVLKDASATAVYGVKGANGVILITTKRGKEGRAKIEVGMNIVAKVASKLPGKKDSYDALAVRNDAIENELGLSPASWSKITSAATLDKYRHPANLEEAERYPNIDWEREMFRRAAMSYNPNINISGGTKSVKYFVSVDFLHEGDLYKSFDNGRGYGAGYGYNRLNVRSNLDFQLTKTTTLKANLFGSNGMKKGPWNRETNSWAETQLWQAVYSAPPDAFLTKYSDGSWGYYPADELGAPNSVYNMATAGMEKRTITRINTDFTLEQDLGFIVKGLKASATVSWDNVFVEWRRGINDDLHNAQRKWINPETGEATYKEANDGNTNFDYQEGIKWNMASGEMNNDRTERNLFYQAQLFWGNTFGKHDVTAMGVFNRTERARGSEFTHYREDWAFRTTYNYGGRYFFEYNGAYNGSEKFSKKNRFAFFNSGAVGWMASEEKFFEPLRKYVGMLKFRYSYGEVGDDNVGSRWLYVTQWAYGNNSQQGLDPNMRSPYTWYRENSVGNEDVHWEKAVKQNFGVDYSFFDGLIAGSLDFFHESRKDILIDGARRAVPSYYGTTAPTANLGSVSSHGYELEMRVNKVLTNGMRFWGNFNMTHALSKVVEYDDASLLPDYQKIAGYSIGQFKSYLSNGYANDWDQVIAMTPHNTNDNQKLPGMYQIIDYNGDGVIDTNDRAPYGYTDTPQNTYSATIGWEWKGFSVMMQFYGVSNVSRYVVFNSLSGKLNTVYDEGSYWSKDNLNADKPMPRWNSTPNGDYFRGTSGIYDGSYIRLKNAEIAYTWTRGWIRHLGLTSLRLYVNGNNLLTYSKMPDDRENNYAGTGNASQGAYPTVRRFNLGLKFTL